MILVNGHSWLCVHPAISHVESFQNSFNVLPLINSVTHVIFSDPHAQKPICLASIHKFEVFPEILHKFVPDFMFECKSDVIHIDRHCNVFITVFADFEVQAWISAASSESL